MLSKFLLDFLSLLDEEAEDLGVVFWARSVFIIQYCVFRVHQQFVLFVSFQGKRK